MVHENYSTDTTLASATEQNKYSKELYDKAENAIKHLSEIRERASYLAEQINPFGIEANNIEEAKTTSEDKKEPSGFVGIMEDKIGRMHSQIQTIKNYLEVIEKVF
jgi:hypothetical protein